MTEHGQPDQSRAPRGDAVGRVRSSRATSSSATRPPWLLEIQSSAGNRAVGRWLAAQSPGPGPGVSETPVVSRIEGPGAAGLLVDDMAEPEPHQRRRGEFLAALRAALTATAQDVVVGTPWPAPGGSEIDAQLVGYASLPAAALEQTIRREVPAAAGARTADALIPAICARVRADAVRDLSTGATTTVQGLAARASGFADQVAAAAGGLLSGITALFKRRGGRTGVPPGIPSLLGRLGPGRPLSAGVQARMQGSLGVDLSGTRIHTDGQAAGLADELNARAFTIGSHVAFGAGEYAPGTPGGDGLLAHELAHVVQQRGEETGIASEDTTVEAEADHAAAHALGALWGHRDEAARYAGGSTPPVARGGWPRLSRCKRAPTPPPTAVHNLPDSENPLSCPGEQILFGALYQSTRPADFRILYVAQGGATFDAPGGPTTKTLDALAVTGQRMFLPTTWPDGTRITVEFKIQRKSDGAIVTTKTWAFGKKTFMPTGLLQFGSGIGPDEVPLPRAGTADFEYILDPRPPEGWTGVPGGPYYENYTILEEFGPGTCNLVPDDFTDAARRNPDNSSTLASPASIAALFHRDSFRGTFTVNRSDMIVDQHSDGGFADQAVLLMRLLKTLRAVQYDHVQTYRAGPSTVLARFTIRMTLHTDGRATIQKIPTR